MILVKKRWRNKIFDAFIIEIIILCGIIKKVNGELTEMNTLYSFASTAIRKKCKTLQNKIQISFCTEINTNLVKRH